MFIITKETAEAYRKGAVRPGDATQTLPFAPGDAPVLPTPGTEDIGQPLTDVGDQRRQPTPQQKAEITWSGEVPSQKWMNFYTKFLTKLGVSSGLTLTVKVECRPEGGLSPQKLEEMKSALRELGLDDRIE